MVKLSPLIALFLIAWMTLITLLSAYYVLTMKQYDSVDTWIVEPKMSMYYEDDIALPDEFAFARSARDHYLQQEFPQNHQSQHSNKAPVRLGKKNNRTDFEDVKLLSSLLPHITNITRISTPTPHTFRNYIAPVGLPVIFTDLLTGTVLDHWSWDMVKEQWGDTVFRNTRQGNLSSKANKHGKHYVNRVSVKLSHFIDVVTGKKEPDEKEKLLYITKQRILPTQTLNDYFFYPPFYSAKKYKKCFLEPTGWIGAAGTYTQGHIDSKDNFVYQLIGRKRWTIYPPTDHAYLYYVEEKGSLEWSRVLSAPGKPDLEEYPLYAKTHPVKFILEPGEVLYLPRGWTHFVENITPALMLNVWRRGPAAITEQWLEDNRQEIRNMCY